MDSETTQELIVLRNHSEITVDGEGFLSVQKHTVTRVRVKIKFRRTLTCCVDISYVSP